MNILGNLFTTEDRLQAQSLNQRLTRQQVITANVANSETPGFRALGYDFEDQLASVVDRDAPFPLTTSHAKHFRTEHSEADGTIHPDVFVRPTESIPEDGNTVDVDKEMSKMSQNQILYRSAVELINRKVGILKYAITGGR